MAAPVQRGTAHATFTAPTSTVFTIDASTFRVRRGSDNISIKNESSEAILEVFNDPRVTCSFTGTLKAAQTPLIQGDLITLTFPTDHEPEGAVEFVVHEEPEDSGFGMVIQQSITCKKHAAADYSPA